MRPPGVRPAPRPRGSLPEGAAIATLAVALVSLVIVAAIGGGITWAFLAALGGAGS